MIRMIRAKLVGPQRRPRKRPTIMQTRMVKPRTTMIHMVRAKLLGPHQATGSSNDDEALLVKGILQALAPLSLPLTRK